VPSFTLLAMGDHWAVEEPDDPASVDVAPCMLTSSGDTRRAGALQHVGIILQTSFLVGDDLRSGALVELMPTYRSVELGICAVYPTRKYVSPKVRLLIDYLIEAFRAADWGGSARGRV
jgi:DNA-binding transcriptional LysR family regulator